MAAAVSRVKTVTRHTAAYPGGGRRRLRVSGQLYFYEIMTILYYYFIRNVDERRVGRAAVSRTATTERTERTTTRSTVDSEKKKKNSNGTERNTERERTRGSRTDTHTHTRTAVAGRRRPCTHEKPHTHAHTCGAKSSSRRREKKNLI